MRLTILLLCSLLTTATGADKQIHRITIAQLKVTRDIDVNLAAMKKAFAQANRDQAEWIVFPEAMLSGYFGGFDQTQVASAFMECQALCKKHKLTGLIGTCWKENGKVFNQVRIVDTNGKLVDAYAKRCLTYGDAKWAAPGTTDLVFQTGGLKFGTLICNDLWVTPGFTDGPNPHLTLKQKNAGAQLIFQSIHSGSSMKYREYHESNLHLRAAEAGFPIITCNAFSPPAVNAASGVVGTKFKYLVQLPRDEETVQTVEVRLSAKKGTDLPIPL
jgi:predicted amidohydrolase